MANLKILKNENATVIHTITIKGVNSNFQPNASKDCNLRYRQQEINKKHKCPD